MEAKMTEYKGVYFRSRLEVKWCQFFECLGVSFEYEPHLANCRCYFITPQGKTIIISADEFYQLSEHKPFLFKIAKCAEVETCIHVRFSEYFRYKNLEPAKAKFKSNKERAQIKKVAFTMKTLINKLNKG